jgi:hypothetical protein
MPENDLTPAEVKTWLEFAGSTLLAMGLDSPYPRGPHVSWPTFANEAIVAYGYTSERLRPSRPTSVQIALMDEILALPSLIADPTLRRIVHARALVTPIGSRYLFTWVKLGYMLHTDRRKVMRLHAKAIAEIVAKLEAGKVGAIRASMSLP